jgi:hypothetical protein
MTLQIKQLRWEYTTDLRGVMESDGQTCDVWKEQHVMMLTSATPRAEEIATPNQPQTLCYQFVIRRAVESVPICSNYNTMFQLKQMQVRTSDKEVK